MYNSYVFFDTIFPVMFVLVSLLIFSGFIYVFVSGIKTWNKNNHSPRLTVAATIVSKRTSVSHHHGGSDSMVSHTFTSYFVTFQVESGDRMELQVEGTQYGMLVEGDKGSLSFQGTRYLSFERE